MNYKNIYYKIIENAKMENENGKRSLGYFEKHHIQPKSLGGTNEKENLVKLTAREHFICHWLLIKMYDKGTIERNKMLCALWRMQGINENHKRYINSRVYEKLRIEFAEAVSKLTSVSQSGSRNSQFGKKWYTNRDTGESKSFFEKPNEKWIEGRNLFHGETNVIRMIWLKTLRDNGKVSTEKLWNQYHSGNYKKLEDMAIELGISKIALYHKFKKYIPIFSKHKEQKREHFLPDKNLINVFE